MRERAKEKTSAINEGCFVDKRNNGDPMMPDIWA
jgi:hypothetical protein